MGKRTRPEDNEPPARRLKGFEPASILLHARIQRAGEKRGFASARILTHWDEIAGPELAPVTRPVKVGYARAGLGATLTLLVAPAWAPVVEMSRERLRARVNAAYGFNAIGRIVITQTAACGFAEAQAAFAPQAGPPPARTADAEPPPASAPPAPAVEGIRDARLRGALERLARKIAARAARPRPSAGETA
jgi:hypothetical protein